MKDFLLTLEYPYTGFEQIGYIRVKARHANSALNKARKYVKGIFAGGGFGGVKILHCEEITSAAELHERGATVHAEIKALQEKLAALTVEARALDILASSLKRTIK